MSIHVREIDYNGRKEYMLYYPGMTKAEAQSTADKINGGALAKREPLSEDAIALISAECAASAHRFSDYDFARAIEAAHGIGGEI